MIEWWQAILVSLGSSSVVGLTAVWIYVLTARDNRTKEEQRAKVRREEEQRESVRQTRGEELKPIFDYFKLSNRYFAYRLHLETRSSDSDTTLDPDAWPDTEQLSLAHSVAAVTSLRIPGLVDELNRIFLGILDPKRKGGFGSALRAAEQLIEQYIAGIIQPYETDADVRSAQKLMEDVKPEIEKLEQEVHKLLREGAEAAAKYLQPDEAADEAKE